MPTYVKIDGKVEDFNQLVRMSAKKILEKQSHRKEDTNNNIKYEKKKWEEWERERRKNDIVIKGIGTSERIGRMNRNRRMDRREAWC